MPPRGASGEGVGMLREYARSASDAAGAPWTALLARDALDWAVVVVLFLISAGTDGAEPFHQYLQTEQLWAYSYPLQRNTVPSWSVLPLAYLLPAAVLLALHASKQLERRDTAKLLLGLFYACSFTLFVTNVVKLLVGRPRPNFAARCWPDGVRVGVPGVPVCSGEAHSVREGRKSFPSGHTSLATAGLAYLSFFLLATVRPRAAADGGAAWRTTAALSPLLLAMWVGLTRVRDYWHHWSDVATGAALGACIAYTCLHKVAALRVLPVPTTSASPAASEPSSAGDEPEAAGEP